MWAIKGAWHPGSSTAAKMADKSEKTHHKAHLKALIHYATFGSTCCTKRVVLHATC